MDVRFWLDEEQKAGLSFLSRLAFSIMALPKAYRLNKNEVKCVFENGETVGNSFFFIAFFKNDKDHLRLAVAVSVKISKKSVIRNRIKRAIAGAVKESYLYKEPFDVVIVVTKAIVGKAMKEIKRELKQTIEKKFVK